MPKLLIILLSVALCLQSQTRINLQNQAKAGSGTVLPATCTPGQTFFKSDSVLVYTCTATNTWTVLGSGGGGGTNCTASTPSFSATPTFSLAANPCVIIPGVMSAPVTAVVWTNTTAGQRFSVTWTQPSSGGPYAVTYGGSTFGTCGIGGGANSTILQNFQVQPDGTTVRGVDCLTSESYAEYVEAALPSFGKAGSDLVQGNSATHTPYCNYNNGGWVPCSGGPTPLATGTSTTLLAPRGYYVCTGACTVAVPVPAAGYEFCVFNTTNVAGAITLSALGSSARYENSARTAYGTAGTGTLVSGGAVGDKVCLLGLDSTHYLTASFTGTWVAN